MRVFIINYSDGRKTRIKASWFIHNGPDQYAFHKDPKKSSDDDDYLDEHFDALIENKDILSIVPQDMLLSSFDDNTVLPDIVSDEPASTDFAHDALFSDADKTPFTPPERERLTRAIRDVEQHIADTFRPTSDQFEDIKQKLAYLARKVASLDKFNWKRLLITTLVGISVDLGFGTLIPSALLELFKQVFSHFSERSLPTSLLELNDRNG